MFPRIPYKQSTQSTAQYFNENMLSACPINNRLLLVRFGTEIYDKQRSIIRKAIGSYSVATSLSVKRGRCTASCILLLEISLIFDAIWEHKTKTFETMIILKLLKKRPSIIEDKIYYS